MWSPDRDPVTRDEIRYYLMTHNYYAAIEDLKNKGLYGRVIGWGDNS
jgi:hypothetical protein